MPTIVAVILLSALTLFPAVASAQSLAPSRKEEVREKLEKGEHGDPDAQLREKASLAQVNRDQFLEGTRQVLADLDALTAEEASVATELAALRTNDAGRAIGADATQRRAFAEIAAHPRLRPEEITSRRARVDQLAKVVASNGATEHSLYTPSTEMTGQLERERAWVTTKLSAARDDRSALRGVAASAAAPPAGSTLPTLADALDQARAADLAGKAAADRQTQEEKDAADRKTQEEIDLADNEARRRRARDAAQVARDAEDPAVLAEYAPLLQSRQKTLHGTNVVGGTRVPSLTELEQRGVTRDLNAFYRLGNARGGAQWPETEPLDRDEMAALEARMARFRDLAPLWVKQGRLSP